MELSESEQSKLDKNRVNSKNSSDSPAKDLEKTDSAPSFRLYAFAGITFAFLVLCVFLLFPFLPAVTWGVALAILLWPVHRKIVQKVGYPGLVAFCCTAVVAIVIVSASVFVTYQLALEAGSAAEAASKEKEKSETPIHDRAKDIAGLGRVVQWMDKLGVDIEVQVRKVADAYMNETASLARGSLAAVLQFLVSMFLLYYLLRDYTLFANHLASMLPLSEKETQHAFTSVRESVHANLYATVITSVIDTIGGGLIFWWVGLPAPALWASVMFLLSLMPIVGAGMVWGPAALYLMATGHVGSGALLFSWGLLSFFLVDNLLYVRLAGDNMKMHPVTAMIAFLGGIAIFGVSGMILGPAIVAVTTAFLEVWQLRVKQAT